MLLEPLDFTIWRSGPFSWYSWSSFLGLLTWSGYLLIDSVYWYCIL